MTQIVDTGRPGKKRYRVRWQGMGGSRTAEFAHPCDAYREFYLRERFAWESASEQETEKKQQLTLKDRAGLHFG